MNTNHPFEDGLTREEILIGRVTDGEASPTDWAELQRLANADPGVLARLAEAQRSHAALEQAVEDRIAICELIEARAFTQERGAVLGRIGIFTGWAAAAAFGVMWWTTMHTPTPQQPSGEGTLASNTVGNTGRHVGTVGSDPSESGADTIPVFENYDPDTVYAGYLDSGAAHNRVVGVMPNEVVSYRATEDGRYEVIFIKRVIERRVYSNLKQLDQRFDDVGNTHVVVEPVPAGRPRGAL
ncbi:MAG: hypothetical protein KDA21_12265 [Phycisphaerales bacterium]|nr:hypothetical protein [Phycisphaerales bacterium]